MMTVPDVSPEESTEFWVDGTVRGVTSSPESREELYEEYREEGHLSSMFLHGLDDPVNPVWFIACSCGETPYGSLPLNIEEVALLNYGQICRWHRKHRSDHGLEKQELCPVYEIPPALN